MKTNKFKSSQRQQFIVVRFIPKDSEFFAASENGIKTVDVFLKNGNTKKKNEEEYQNATISILPFIYYQLILFT